MTRRSRAVTIIELSIASAVFLLLMTAAFMLLTQGLRAWSSATVRADNQNDTLVTFGRLANHLEHSDSASLTVYSGPATICTAGSGLALSFLQSDGTIPYDPTTGGVVWGYFEVWYLAADSTSLLTNQALFVETIPVAGGVPTTAPNPYKLVSYPDSGTRVLANVATFAISSSLQPAILQLTPTAPVFQNPVNLVLQVKTSRRTLSNQTSVLMLENETLDPALVLPAP